MYTVKTNEKQFPFHLYRNHKSMFQHMFNWVYSMHYFKINLFYFFINIEFVCSPSFMPIHISKYRRPEKASWRMNNAIKYIPNIVIWESILYNMCITNQYLTLDLLIIQIFLQRCSFEKGQHFLRDCIHYNCKLFRSNWYLTFINKLLTR